MSLAKYLIDRREKALTKVEIPIVSASGVIEIKVAWDALGNSSSWKSFEVGNGAYIAFGKGDDVLMVMRSTQIVGETENKKDATVKIFVDLNTPNSEVKRPITLLGQAEFVQIGTLAVPRNSQILSGFISCVFNGNMHVDIPIPAQQMEEDRVFVPNLQAVIVMYQTPN